jgi:hypothetical protein
MSTDFDVVDAAWSRERALEFASALDVRYIVVRNAVGGGRAPLYYLFFLEDFRRELEQSQGARVSDLLSALEPTPALLPKAARRSATRAIVVEGGKPVGVVEAAAQAAPMMPEMALEASAGSAGQPPVPRTLVADLPPVMKVRSTSKLTVTLTARAVTGAHAGAFSAPAGAQIDVIVRADAPLAVVGKATHTFTVQDPQPDDAQDFDIEATAEGTGRVEIDAYHNGVPVAALAATTAVESVLPAAAPPSAPQSASVDLVDRARTDLALFIFERGDEITFFLQSADGRYNMDDYPPVKLRTPREYFQEFFRTIEKLDADEGRDKLAKQGLNLFRTAIPEELQRALWSFKDRVRTLQINSDEPWIPWEVCKLEGVVDGSVEEGPFFAEAFKVTRWFRRVPAVPRITLDNIALVVPSDSGLASAAAEKDYVAALGSATRSVKSIAATRADVEQAMQAAVYDGWHFTGHARASATADADQSPIELENSEKLTPADIVGRTSNFLKTRPFVFLNACQSAQAGMSLTGAGGWAQRLIKVPADRPSAAAFVGTYWQVDDDKAFAFAKALYDRLIVDGMPIGQAAHEARRAAQSRDGEPYDTSWLAYTVYADPSATVG